MDWEVGGCHSESHGIGDVVNRLYDSISIDIAVASSSNPIRSLHLLLGLSGMGEPIVILSNVILCVELGVGAIHGLSNAVCRNYRSCLHSVGRREVVAIVRGVGKVGVVDLWRDC